MKNEKTWMAVEGIPFLAGGGVCTLLFFWFGFTLLALIALAFSLFSIYFFRNPNRKIPTEGIVSPADGKVIFIGETKDPEFGGDTYTKVSIFMNLWDVHFNRMPVQGTIEQMKYSSGKFLAAFDERASEENERQAYLISAGGKKYVLVQIAGLVARRIVPYLKTGQNVSKGERIGLIRFGSRCDLYLPKGTPVKTSVGQFVKGGETILAELERANAS